MLWGLSVILTTEVPIFNIGYNKNNGKSWDFIAYYIGIDCGTQGTKDIKNNSGLTADML